MRLLTIKCSQGSGGTVVVGMQGSPDFSALIFTAGKEKALNLKEVEGSYFSEVFFLSLTYSLTSFSFLYCWK